MDAKIHKFLIVRNFRYENFVQLKISPNVILFPPPTASFRAPRAARNCGRGWNGRGRRRGVSQLVEKCIQRNNHFQIVWDSTKHHILEVVRKGIKISSFGQVSYDFFVQMAKFLLLIGQSQVSKKGLPARWRRDLQSM